MMYAVSPDQSGVTVLSPREKEEAAKAEADTAANLAAEGADSIESVEEQAPQAPGGESGNAPSGDGQAAGHTPGGDEDQAPTPEGDDSLADAGSKAEETISELLSLQTEPAGSGGQGTPASPAASEINPPAGEAGQGTSRRSGGGRKGNRQ